MSRSKDLTFTLSSKRICLELWSSDSTRFAISNKIINTTLDNTIADIKELISIRSQDEGGDLNPRALKIFHRQQERQPYEPLSEFFQQVNYNERLRVEFNLDQLGTRNIRPTMMNVVLKLSTGKKVTTRETLCATISSLIEIIADHTDLSVDDIEHLEYNGGEVITDVNQTLGDLLKLDIAPLGDLTLYVKRKADFLIRLSTPTESIVRTNKFFAGLETNIFIIKNYIIDQYTGSAQISEEDIKVIYFGRILSETALLREVFPNFIPGSVTLHFVIKEPEPQQASGGFWNDLQRGALFEFLPSEPNPNFEVEVQRDERLRQQLRSGSIVEHPTESVLVQDTQPTPNATSTAAANTNDAAQTASEPAQPSGEFTPTTTEFINGAPILPNGIHLTGRTIEVASLEGVHINVDQTQTSSTVYKISINSSQDPRDVALSSSQLIINDSDPENSYVMLSPSGFAQLSTLGVTIEKPEIVIEEEVLGTDRIEIPPLPQHAQDSPGQHFEVHGVPAGNPVGAGTNGAGIGIGIRLRIAEFELLHLTRLFSLLFQFVLIYFFIIDSIQNVYLRVLTGLAFIVYGLSRPANRPLVRQAMNFLPGDFGRALYSPLRAFARINGTTLDDIFTAFFSKLMSLLDPVPGRLSVVQFLYNRSVEVILFFTSFFMPLHNRFLIQLNERNAREEQRRESERLYTEAYELHPDEDTTRIPDVNGATGAQTHAEE